MNFVGLDLSLTGSGLTIIDEVYQIVNQVKLSVPQKGAERLFFLKSKFLEFVAPYIQQIKLCCIEGAAYHETGRIYELGQWSGIVLLDLFEKGLPVISAAPLQLKKYACGEGKNQKKSLVVLDVYKNFGVEIRDEDLADSYVLARIAHDYHTLFIEGGNELLPNIKKYQLDVLNKIHETNSKKSLI